MFTLTHIRTLTPTHTHTPTHPHTRMPIYLFRLLLTSFTCEVSARQEQIFTSRTGDVYTSRTGTLSTDRTGAEDVYEELSFFLHKTNGALMMLIRFEDYEDDFDEDDENEGGGRGVLRVNR